VRRNDEVEAQRSRWAFYETINHWESQVDLQAEGRPASAL
jgi:hypothetical protein